MMILEKLNELKKRFLDSRADIQDVRIINSWYEEARKLLLLKSLKEHDGIKYVLDIFKNEIISINKALKSQYSKELPDRERDRLLDKRDLAIKYVQLFDTVDKDLENLEELVDRENV